MIFRGVPLPSIVFLLPVRTLDILFGGGGGGDVLYRVLCFWFGSGYHVFVFVYCCFDFRSMQYFQYVPHISCVLFLVLHAVIGGV